MEPAPLENGHVDLAALLMAPGEGRRMSLDVELDPLELGGNSYAASKSSFPIALEVSRTVGDGWAFRIAGEVELEGPCTRCLAPAAPKVKVEAREVSTPGGGDELDSPYLDEEEILDVKSWLRDSVVLAIPGSILCHSNCPGLCEECGVRLATAGPEHHHEKPPDPRWAALRDLSE